MAKGCDYSFSKPSAASLQAAGYRFACRYVLGSSGKRITRNEANTLWAHGVDVVTNAEAYPQDPLRGHDLGVTHARTADAQHKAAGGPAGKPIYFSVDFDVQPHQAGAVKSYLDGAASVIGRGRVGAYGGIRIISYLFDSGTITYGWQTYAWSRGHWDSRAQIRQTHNGVRIGGGEIDIDESVHANFGAWHGATQEIGPAPGHGELGPASSGAWDPSPALSGWVDAMTHVAIVLENGTRVLNGLRK